MNGLTRPEPGEPDMRYAFMSFSAPTASFEQLLDLARRFGYEGIEPRMDADHAHGIELTASQADRGRFRDAAEQAGVAIACLATSLRYADPAGLDDAISASGPRIDLAGDIGASALRVFGGAIPEGIRRDQAIETVAEALRALADHAARRGVTICLETHDDWCDPSHVAEVLGRVDHPAVGANWDIMHPPRTGKASVEESFGALAPWIRHLHVHDGQFGQELQFAPIGTGDVDHARAIELLVEAGYEGFVSGEWINWQAPEDHLPREIATLRRLEAAART
jgi:sugar phosphate isomerase/epimerase